MRVGILSTYDTEGGAGRAAYRLHQALLRKAVDSRFLALHKTSDDVTVTGSSAHLGKYQAALRADLDRLPLLLYPRRQKKFFTPSILRNARAVAFAQSVDVVNIHWVSAGFMGVRDMSRVGKPVIFTLHDSWAFTGGCHVPGNCTRYTDLCGKCPQLGSSSRFDLSYFILRKKRSLWRKMSFTVVTTGSWLAQRAAESKLFAGCRIEVVNPGLDLDLFKPIEKGVARQILNIGSDAKLILFGAVGPLSDANKGYQHLDSALKLLAAKRLDKRIEIGIFGAGKPIDVGHELFRTHYLGSLKDAVSLPIVYSAADVMVVPSLQEAFGQTASESMACGTPVVAFDCTGLKDSVDHMKNGFLARPYESDELAAGIHWVLADEMRWHALSLAARQKAVRSFGLDGYAARYCQIYEQTMQMSPPSRAHRSAI